MSMEGSNSSNTSQFGLSSVHVTSQNAPGRPPPTSVFTNTKVARWAARMPETTVNSFCGAVAGAASGIVTCPLDVIKTKLQAQGGFRPRSSGPIGSSGSPSYRGLLGTAKVIWQQDGLRGMYRGLSPMLFGYLPTWAVYMSVYGASRDYFYTKIDTNWMAQACASVTAGACSTLTTNPIWVIKTRLMAQVGSAASKEARTPWHYRGTIDAARKMFKSEGIGVFYSGLGPALLGLTHVAIQFPLYEFFKLQFTGVQMGESSGQPAPGQSIGILAATFLSKVCATTATYPHEVLRTRLQTTMRQHHPPSNSESPRYIGVLKTCRTILAEEGWRAFYHGMGTNLIRAVPSAMTTMLTFESLKNAIHRLQEEGRAAAEQ